MFLQEGHRHIEAKTVVFFSKKKNIVLCLPSCVGLENVTEMIRAIHFFFPQKHFPQIIPFMVDWLRTLGCRFPYLTWGGGVAAEE